MKPYKWRIMFKLTLKTSVYFDLDSEQECKELKAKCLKEGIEAETNYQKKIFYPAKRINEVSYFKTQDY